MWCRLASLVKKVGLFLEINDSLFCLSCIVFPSISLLKPTTRVKQA